MTRRKQFVLSVADRPGLLGRLVSRLWENGVTISELEAVVDGGRVAVHLTVDEPAVVREILAEWVECAKRSGYHLCGAK